MTWIQPAVIKVGGSLLEWDELPGRLTTFLALRRELFPRERPILVVGGGPVVDIVRRVDKSHTLGDQHAHDLAVRCLDLTAAMLGAMLPRSRVVDRLDAIPATWIDGVTPILSPRPVLEVMDQSGEEPLPASWEVTSDSIAARIAAHSNVGCLVLLKSAHLPEGASQETAVKLGLVDARFPEFARAIARVEYLNLRQRGAETQVLTP